MITISNTRLLGTIFFIVVISASYRAQTILDGIVPLVTTRKEINLKFGQPTDPGCFECYYETSTAKVLVSFSKDKNCAGEKSGWAVGRDKVIRLVVTPKEKLDFKNLVEGNPGGIELPGSGANRLVVFPLTGRVFETDLQGDFITAMRLIPKIDDSANVCAGSPAYNPVASLYQPFFRHDGSDWASIKAAMLTPIMMARNASVGTKIYLVGYRDLKTSTTKHLSLLERIKRLVSSYGLGENKFSVIDGGLRGAFVIEFFAVSADLPPPMPIPEYIRQ